MQHIAVMERVRKAYGQTLALDDVSFELSRGEVLGVLGPNGAGKSTAVSLLTGLRAPDGGRVELLGGDPRNPATRDRLGTTPQATGFPETLRVAEVVDFVARHYLSPRPAGEVLDELGIGELAKRQTGGLSGGEKRRLAIALAFVGDPEVVVLDEPTSGLDVQGRREVWDRITAYVEQGGTVLLTSHDMAEVERLADRVVVIGDGRVLTCDTVAEVRRLVDVRTVSFVAAGAPSFRTWDEVVAIEEHAGRHQLTSSDADALVRRLCGSDVDFRDLEVSPVSLEDAFLTLTGGVRAPAAAPSARAKEVL